MTRRVLHLPGGGIFFVWQLGMIKCLKDRGLIDRVDQFRGASTGALVAALTACDVDPDRAIEDAYALCLEHDIFNRPMGLAGIWAAMIRRWLDALLPEDAARRCTGRVRIAATEVPSLTIAYFDAFESKDDLIGAIMTSVHIPIFLDGKPFCAYRSKTYMDGCILLDLHPELELDSVIVVDHALDGTNEDDPNAFAVMPARDRIDRMRAAGYAYAERVIVPLLIAPCTTGTPTE